MITLRRPPEPCPDCNDTKVLHLIGEDLPCWNCQAEEFETAMRERCIEVEFAE